eukprot:Gb_11141 [translate_table: standard]
MVLIWILGGVKCLKWWEICMAVGSFLLINFWLQRNAKGPVRWPVVGMLPSLLLNTYRLYEWNTDILKACGGTYVFRGPSMSVMHSVITCDPANIEYALKINFSNFPKGEAFRIVFHDLLGDGIFNADSQSWRLQRKIASIQFNSRSFRQFTANAVEETVEEKLIPLLADAAERKATIDVQDVFLRYTFDNTCSTVFGRSPGCLSLGLPEIPFAKAFDDGVQATLYRHLMPRIWWRVFRLLKVGKERQFHRALKPLREFVDDLVAYKKQMIAQGKGGEMKDLLSCFMQQLTESHEDGNIIPYTDEFLRDTVMNFVIAGRDTSGVALTWFFWLLSDHPEVEEKILNELSDILRRRDFHEMNKPLSAEELQESIYLHAALSETLRLYPSVPIDHKGVLAEDVLPDGTHIKPGMRFMYSIYSVGRMESIWGPDCLEFKPERWIVKGEDGRFRMRNESMFKFVAFNAGPRVCLGKGMAYMQMKAAAAAVLRRFHVRVVANQVVVPKISVILSMKNGLLVTLQERTPLPLI